MNTTATSNLHAFPQRQTCTKNRLKLAKRAFSTRNIDLNRDIELRRDLTPNTGDLVLARVSTIGQHKRIERTDGRRSQLYAGDEVIVCFGARYAPDQFEAVVPEDLEPCHLVAAGGIAGKVLNKHARMSSATRLQPIGLLCCNGGQPINVSETSLPALPAALPPVIAVFGSSMNAGKTTTAARLIRGFTRAGLRVGAAKITGTGAGGDYWSMMDAGAERVLDFTDAGLATTSLCETPELIDTMKVLTSQLAADGVDLIILEVADGLLQKETAALVKHPTFKSSVNGLLFAASDALGALHGEKALHDLGYGLLGLSGSFTASPLAVREVEAACETSVFMKTDLSNPQVAQSLMEYVQGDVHEVAYAS